jgi:hypothetical protein
MRFLGLLLAAAGAVALVMGILATLGATRTVPFAYEATNHVGQIIGGLVALPMGLVVDKVFRGEKPAA